MEKPSSEHGDYSLYMSGGVPPLAFFQFRVSELIDVVSATLAGIPAGFLAEICMIGLAAYFEVFCKDLFAALINICPHVLLAHFSSKRDCKIPAYGLVHSLPNIGERLGFLIAEDYDFGTAKSVNSLFFDLLKITPFSKDEAARYGDFLSDRNLLVHHGGVFTLRYTLQKLQGKSFRERVHMDSLQVSEVDLRQWSEFLLKIARKMAESSASALRTFTVAEGFALPVDASVALEALEWEI